MITPNIGTLPAINQFYLNDGLSMPRPGDASASVVREWLDRPATPNAGPNGVRKGSDPLPCGEQKKETELDTILFKAKVRFVRRPKKVIDVLLACIDDHLIPSNDSFRPKLGGWFISKSKKRYSCLKTTFIVCNSIKCNRIEIKYPIANIFVCWSRKSKQIQYTCRYCFQFTQVNLRGPFECLGNNRQFSDERSITVLSEVPLRRTLFPVSLCPFRLLAPVGFFIEVQLEVHLKLTSVGIQYIIEHCNKYGHSSGESKCAKAFFSALEKGVTEKHLGHYQEDKQAQKDIVASRSEIGFQGAVSLLGSAP